MKDIPVFSCPDGIATLILREVPFRGEGYILVRGVFGTLEGLLAECAGFCRAAGAERLFAAGEADFSGYPAAIRILGRSAPRESLLPAPEAVRLVPVTEKTAADWAREYNARFRAVPAAESCSPAEERALAAGGEAAFTGIEGLRMRVSRIYRDMRMHPPVPYKETSWMCLRHDGASWLEHPCLFFELTSEGYSYGLLLWNPRAAAMERWRTQLGDRTEEFLQMAARAERETGLQLGGRAYVRPKQTPDARLAPYYSLRNVSMMRECPLGDELYTPRLAETVRDTLHALLPLYEFCLSAVG